MQRDKALNMLRQHAQTLRAEFGVAHLDVFGSVARDEAGSDSDIDILVEFLPDAQIGLFEFVGLKDHLEDYLGVRVDLATEEAIKKQFKEQVLQEKIRAA